ncbi:hypothetical protein H0W32_01390 [Patescibacteria group bacterium]|nr:hypothetical protein [Patescibacteria group bacterium]
MINLLPDSEKNVIRKEYRLRVIAVVFVGIFLTALVTIIFLLPSYILVVFKNMTSEQLMNKAPTTKVDQEDFVATLRKAKMAALILKPNPTVVTMTDVVGIINKNKTSNIAISSISYSKDNSVSPSIDIIGIAKTRQSLVGFTQLLQKEEQIALVDLPVSSFAKDTDIPFSIAIKIK